MRSCVVLATVAICQNSVVSPLEKGKTTLKNNVKKSNPLKRVVGVFRRAESNSGGNYSGLSLFLQEILPFCHFSAEHIMFFLKT